MTSRSCIASFAAILFFAGKSTLGAAGALPQLPGLQRDGSVLLPNQWSVHPVGRQLPLGDFPIQIAVHPGGRFLAVLHSGWGQHEIRIVEPKTMRTLSQVNLEESFYGLVWSPTGDRLYASGASAEKVYAFSFKDGYLSAPRLLSLSDDPKTIGVPAGLALSDHGSYLYAAETLGQRVEKIATADGRKIWTRQLASPGYASPMDAEAERMAAAQTAEAVYPFTCLADEKHGRLFVTLWGASSVLVLDEKTGVETARWGVGPHPNEMVLSRDGRLFVAEANLNSVSVLDAASGRVIEKLSTALFPTSPPGSMPNSLALSSGGERLYVANATNNNVAVFDVETRGRAKSLGFIPAGWFPTSVRLTVDGKSLLIANGKGGTSAANPRGPFPGTTAPRNLQEYIGGLMQGTLSIVDLPAGDKAVSQLGNWTRTAYACSPLEAANEVRGQPAENNPIPNKVGDPSPLTHVIYIVRENRTYDQVFGDISTGNGEAQLCLFPEEVTPNGHALAREFVLLDNFFADGEVSADGHEWTMAAFATDFVEKTWPLSYGHNASKKYDYPSEGRYPVAFPANGYLWNRAAEAGVSYRSYGEFCETVSSGPEQARPALPILQGHIDPYYRGWDLSFADVKRAERFATELKRFEVEGAMPRLQVVRLGNDHTEGTKAGAHTPSAMVADNDAALGLVIDAVTKSRFWPTTAIFVLEDDAQNGPDHVDAHRIPVLCISPYTKRHAVDSTLYSTTSMLRTIELILGLQPMSQYDAAAKPLYASFTSTVDLTSYTALPPRIDVTARNTKLAWGAKESSRMDFSEPDQADDIALNEIVWRSVRGKTSPMPAPIRAAFFKAHPAGQEDK